MKGTISYVIKAVITFLFGIGLFFAWKHLQHPSPYDVNTSQTAVIKEVRQLQRLETASFTIEKIIDAKTQGNMFQQWLFGDKILLIAHGEVIAGIDLSQISEQDISVDGKKLSIKLPAPSILVTRLDNDKTQVYDRQQGLLTKGDKDLESEARKAAEKSIEQAACDEDILKTAATNAQNQLTALFKGLGFEDVQIEIPAGQCSAG